MSDQVSDRLEFEGGLYWLDQGPMGSCPNVERFRYRARSTANFRGYEAVWAVSQGKLWLVDFSGNGVEQELHRLRPNPLIPDLNLLRRVCIRDLFDGDEGPVLASWYSGRISASSRLGIDQFVGEVRCGEVLRMAKSDASCGEILQGEKIHD